MSLPTKTKRFILAHKPTSLAVLEGENATFKLVTQDLPELNDGQVLAQTLFLSNDPAQRGWISPSIDPKRLYTRPVEEGEVMKARGILKILDSKADNIKIGSLVTGGCGWSEYCVLPASEVQLLQEIPGLSPTHFLGALGMTGLTAYYGLVEVVGAKAGESVVVSGAAGATGSMVVQIAKHIVGCNKVIGLAGTDEKCRWVESLGADQCINYKNANWKEQLTKATEGYIDIYFDNVGGEQLDFMLTRLKMFGRVSACGAISSYNEADPGALKNYFQVIIQRLNIKGFVVLDYFKDGKAAEGMNKLIEAAKSGQIKVGDENETVIETKLEDIPKTWMMLFDGRNRGKLVTKLV